MADKRTRYKIPKGVKKEAMMVDLRRMHGYGGGKVTKMQTVSYVCKKI